MAVSTYLAPSWLQSSPTLAMRTATSAFLQSKGNVEAVNQESIYQALARAPLEDEPFTFAAAKQFKSAETTKTEELLRVALLRNPRSREARIFLLELLVNEGRVSDSIEQIEVLSRLMPERRGFFQSNLLYLATRPDTRSEAIASIADEGARRDLIWSLGRAGASASMILDTYEAFDGFDLGDDSEAIVNRWIQPLIDREDYDGARRIWARFNPEADDDSLLIDDAFSGQFAPPFGWAARSGPQGYVELGKNGLSGEYYGRSQALLAQQLMLLSSGSYKIAFRDLANAEALEFVIRCIKGDELAAGRIDSELAVSFEVPPDGCDAQSLAIRGRPTEPPRSTVFEIGNIALERATL